MQGPDTDAQDQSKGDMRGECREGFRLCRLLSSADKSMRILLANRMVCDDLD